MAAALRQTRQEDFPYGCVSSVQTSTAMMSGKLTIFASGNKAEIKGVVPKERVSEIGDYVRGRIGESGAASARAAPVGGAAPEAAPSPAAQLREIGELRDAGLITPEEFESKKAEILARI
jgi:hypothetical protein